MGYKSLGTTVDIISYSFGHYPRLCIWATFHLIFNLLPIEIHPTPIMITDQQLNSLAIFLGTLMMGLIVLYHFLSVNGQYTESKSTEGGAEKVPKHKPAILGAK